MLVLGSPQEAPIIFYCRKIGNSHLICNYSRKTPWGLPRNFHWRAIRYLLFFYLRFWTVKFFEKFCKNRRFISKIYFNYLFRPWKPCGASKSNGPRSKGQKSSHPMPWTAFGKSWTIKTFIMNQTSLISKQNLWISRMIWHHQKGNI